MKMGEINVINCQLESEEKDIIEIQVQREISPK